MCIFNRNLQRRICRRLYRKSGMLYLACDMFFGVKLKEPVLMLVDTGTYSSVILKDFAKSLTYGCIEYDEPVKIATPQGQMSGYKVSNVPFEDVMDRVFVNDFVLVENAHSLDILTEEAQMPVAGILGTDFMDKYGMIINFKTKEMIL